MSDLASQDLEAGYDREVVERVWQYAQVIPGNDPAGVAALRPMQWQNYLDFMVADRMRSSVTADGLRNARRLV